MDKYNSLGLRLYNVGRKNKTYEEIYGERANEEKEKRKKYGFKKSEETLKKISKKLKGNIPWNKGLTKNTDDRIKSSWNKGLTKENYPKKKN